MAAFKRIVLYRLAEKRIFNKPYYWICNKEIKMIKNSKILVTIFIVAILLIAGCTGIKEKSPLKSEKEASLATSNLTDTIDTVSSNLQEISRTLGR